jgi:hypothetical protein
VRMALLYLMGSGKTWYSNPIWVVNQISRFW